MRCKQTTVGRPSLGGEWVSAETYTCLFALLELQQRELLSSAAFSLHHTRAHLLACSLVPSSPYHVESAAHIHNDHTSCYIAGP